MDYFKKKVKVLQPKIVKGLSNTVQGYFFGCMMGLFTNTEKITLKNIHKSGKNIAKVCAVYSTTETILQTVREKDDIYNKVASGVMAGGLCTKGRVLSKYNLLGAFGLGAYSALNK